MSPTRNTTLMRRSAPIEMRELTDRHRAKRLIAIGEIRTLRLKGQVRDVERDQLGAPKRGGEAERDERANAAGGSSIMRR